MEVLRNAPVDWQGSGGFPRGGVGGRGDDDSARPPSLKGKLCSSEALVGGRCGPWVPAPAPCDFQKIPSSLKFALKCFCKLTLRIWQQVSACRTK